MCNHSSSIDHALAVAKICNEVMNKTNMTLLDDNNRQTNSRMDREMMNMIDCSSTWMHPQQHRDADAALLIAQNQKLWRKLEKKYTCKKCGHSKSNNGRGGVSKEDTLSVIGEVRDGDVEI